MDAGGVTLNDSRGGGGAGCPIIRNYDKNGTTLNTILDTMQTTIETAQTAAETAQTAAIDSAVDGLMAVKVARATYDFAVDGGAISSIGLGVTLPDNAIVTRTYIQVITTLTSSTDAATIALTIPTDDVAGLRAATAISSGTSWDAGFKDGIQDGVIANFSEQCAAEREITATIAEEAVTAGKFIVFCEYIISD